MCSFPPSARAALAHLGDCLDREVARSQRHKDADTAAARQAHYIKWTRDLGLHDPCGPGPSYAYLVALYLKSLQENGSITGKAALRSMTVQGYALAINTLFELRGFQAPINPSDPNNVGNIVISNLSKEENISRKRNPLDAKIFAELQRMANESKSADSDVNLLLDVTIIGRYVGPRVSEYAQKQKNKVDYHVYPSGTRVVKAWTESDFCFRDVSGNTIPDPVSMSPGALSKVTITWRIQKNRENSETVTLSSDQDNIALCPVQAALRMVLRARRLGQVPTMPLACFSVCTTADAVVHYLTGTTVANLLRQAAKSAYPTMSKDQLLLYSAHSLRVWACVLLDEAGKNTTFIKKRLRWKGDSFMMYLRDTPSIQDDHVRALFPST
ncbi:MAG: hypothetical protein FJY85_07770, partial [Deltaproteobacteria bacterium]|nr:hypothetical protein [Deltaproteobacteria bacterium]